MVSNQNQIIKELKKCATEVRYNFYKLKKNKYS